MANFILTEEQYKKAIKEGVLPQGQPTTKTVVDGNGNSNVGPEVNNAVKNTNADTIEVTNFGKSSNTNSTNSTNSNPLAESRLITKKELKENRLKKLRENSEIISVKEIFGI